jgi:hypothetical protein
LETATEINNYGFEIERASSNGSQDHWIRSREKEWEKIGFVSGNGNSHSQKSYTFDDLHLGGSLNYFYRLKQIDIDGNYDYSNILSVKLSAPEVFTLLQNYPNPFNNSTYIAFSVSEESDVKLAVYNIIGEEVGTLVESKLNPGNYNQPFDGSDLESGIYFYTLEVNGSRLIKKMILLK